MSICQIKESKRITRRPVEVLKLGLNQFGAKLQKGTVALAEGRRSILLFIL